MNIKGVYHLEKKDKWYEHAPDSVSENDEVKLQWDMNIQCDHLPYYKYYHNVDSSLDYEI